MPARITLEDILPVICTELRIGPQEVERPITKGKFREILMCTETVVTPNIIDRLWHTLEKSAYAEYSAYRDDTLVLQLGAINAMLVARKHPGLGVYTETNTDTHTQEGSR